MGSGPDAAVHPLGSEAEFPHPVTPPMTHGPEGCYHASFDEDARLPGNGQGESLRGLFMTIADGEGRATGGLCGESAA